MKLVDFADLGIGTLIGRDCEFDSVSTDTRTLHKGDLFLAIKGDNFDAHDLLDEAIEKQCCGAVVEEPQDVSIPLLKVENSVEAFGQIAAEFRARFAGKVVAITGSSGKTSVKGMLNCILANNGTCIATEGNFNNHIGVPLTLVRLNKRADFAVVEAGTSHPGEIGYLAKLIQADISVVTNIMPAHIESFGSLSAIAQEKSELYAQSPEHAMVVVNIDEPYSEIFLDKIGDRAVIGFSTHAMISDNPYGVDSVLYVTDSSIDALGRVHFTAHIAEEEEHFQLRVLGPHHLQNALASLACAYGLGVSLSDAKGALEEYTGAPGRMQLVGNTDNITLIDDSYNANPGSMKAAIDYLSTFPHAILVCGDMGELGEKAQLLHEEVGLYAKAKGVTHVLSVGQLTQFISGAFGENGEHFDNHDVLIDEVERIAEKMGHSVVLVKGSRSARMENVVNALSKRWGMQ